MYFMVGQPTETHEDIEGIVTLAQQRARDRARAPRRAGARARQHVELHPEGAHAVPVGGAGAAATSSAAHRYLRDALKKAGVAFTWEDPEHSLLEAVLSRGDRRLGSAIERAWRGRALRCLARALRLASLAARDGRHRHRPGVLCLPPAGALRLFPWSHINIGVSESYLRAEWMRTLKHQQTADCHKEPCNVCGVQSQNADDCLNRFDLRLAAKGKPARTAPGSSSPSRCSR